MMRGALVVIRERKQRGFGKGAANQLDANRKSAWRETSWDRDRRQSRIGGQRSIAAWLRAPDNGRDAANRGIDDRVEAFGFHRAGDGLRQRLTRGKTALVVLTRQIVSGSSIRNVEDALKARGVKSGLEHLLNRCRVTTRGFQVVAKIDLQFLRQQIC